MLKLTMEPAGPNAGAALLRLAEEAGNFGTWSWGASTGEFDWSSGMFRILGIAPGSAKPSLELYRQLVHPDDRAEFGNPARMVSDSTMADRQFRILRPDGDIRWIKNSGRVIHNADGEPSHLVGIAFDITDTRRAMIAQRQRTGLLDALRELFGIIIWETEADGSVSDPLKWRQGLGIEDASSSGWGRLQAINPDDREKVREAWAEAVRNRSRYAAQFRAQWHGREVTVASRGAAVRDTNGDVLGWIGFGVPLESLLTTDLDPSEPLSADLIRAGRAHLGWTTEELAKQAGVSFSTVRRAEMASSTPVTANSLGAIRRAFEQAGLRFVTTASGAGIIKARSADVPGVLDAGSPATARPAAARRARARRRVARG